jgi:hypothetical protein
MHGEAVKDQHISRVNLAANPIAAQGRAFEIFREMETLMVMTLGTKAMRAFENS